MEYSAQGNNRGTLITDAGKLPVEIEDGQIRVTLPLEMDLEKFTELLNERGYAVANNPRETDSQGWGPGSDIENYHPFWVYRKGARGQWVFAFPPQEYRVGQDGTHYAVIGEEVEKLVSEWYPQLEACTLRE